MLFGSPFRESDPSKPWLQRLRETKLAIQGDEEPQIHESSDELEVSNAFPAGWKKSLRDKAGVLKVSGRRGALEQFPGDQSIILGVFQEWTNEETWEIENVSEEGEDGWEFWVCHSSFELPSIQFLYARINGDRSDDGIGRKLTSAGRLPSCTFQANVVSFMTRTIWGPVTSMVS